MCPIGDDSHTHQPIAVSVLDGGEWDLRKAQAAQRRS
jgi:hypothetical protein